MIVLKFYRPTMYYAVHIVLMLAYLTAPIGALWYGINRAVRGNRWRSLRRLRSAVLAAVTIGLFVCVIKTIVIHGRFLPTQLLVTSYLATAFILLLQWGDQALWGFTKWAMRLNRVRGSLGWYNFRAVSALVLRATILIAIVLPYILATVAVYQPKAGETQTPATMFKWNYQPISFRATDGTRLSGWWIPAPRGDSHKTVILCPNSKGDKSTHLNLVKELVPDDFNVLVFDFRAQGESDGQLSSFGDLERRDVLGAARWLTANKPESCKRVVGLGVGTGAAALLAATADPSAEGQLFDAVAVYESYDRLSDVIGSVASDFLPKPLAAAATTIGLPLAGLQVGTDLRNFNPSMFVDKVAPRPLLFIHGTSDEIFPFESGRQLYQSAAEPKMNLWLEKCNYDKALDSPDAAKLVKRCFDTAGRVI